MNNGIWRYGWLGAIAVFSLAPNAFSNEESAKVAAAQKALKESRLYPGEATGILDRETEAAIRRYQMLHALPVTGKIDPATLDALNLPPSAYVEVDRAFLSEGAAPAASPEAQESRPATVVEALPSPAPEAVAEEAFPQEKLQTYLKNYLKAASYKETRQELSYYANPVEYLEHGTLDEEALKEQLRKDRWSKRQLQFDSVEGITPLAPDTVEVRFKVKVTTRWKKKRSTKTEERLATLKKFPDGLLRVVSLKAPEA